MKSSRTASDDADGVGTGLFSTAVHEQLGRVLASDSFRNSQRMTNFLRFVVSETLAGNKHRLKEYSIAVEVFDRDKSFDPRTNALVRVEASRLRHRLREYFLGPGLGDAIHIELPAGSYVPQFRTTPAEVKTAVKVPPVTVPRWEASLGLPDWPSIAVLPFVFLGDDERRLYLAGGIAEQLITALSRINWLHVTACDPTFASRGWAANRKHLAGRLGVRYALEGTVRQMGNRIRVFARSIDAITGNVLWAQRYDRELSDSFVLEEELGQRIAAAVELQVAAAERERAVRRPVQSLDAWGLYQRGIAHMYRFTSQDSRRAKQLLRRAAAADPQFASPFGALAYVSFLEFVLGFTDAPSQTIADAVVAGRAAVVRDDRDPMAHFGLGRAMSLAGRLDSAKSEAEVAIELNPNFAPGYLGVGGALSLAGRHREAIAALDTAIGLSPYDPMLWTMENMRALSHIELAEFDRAVEDARLACSHPNTVPWSYVMLVSALSNLDREDEAREIRDALFKRWPDFSVSRFKRTVPYDSATTPNWREGLRRAGLNAVIGSSRRRTPG
jgi:adenylate cyclase